MIVTFYIQPITFYNVPFRCLSFCYDCYVPLQRDAGERGSAHPGCVRSRRLRSTMPSAATLRLWTVAPPCPLPAVRRQLSVPLGCAPDFTAEGKELLNLLPKPPPGRADSLSRLFFVSVAKKSLVVVRDSIAEISS